MYNPPSNNYKEIYDEGYLAGEAGLTLEDSPYPFYTDAHWFWSEGWADFQDAYS